MIIIRPTTITPAVVTANNAVNADADYVAGTTYAAGVKVTYNNNIYLSLQAANTGHTPGDTASVAWWSYVTTANRWAAFDDKVGTQTVKADSWTFTLSGDLFDSISLLNMVNVAQVSLTVVKGGTTVASRSLNLLDTSIVQTWGEYFQNTPEYLDAIAVTDLPKVPGCLLTVTCSNIGNTISVGKAIFGQALDGGLEEYGLNRTGTDYTIVTFDVYGAVTLSKQAYTRGYSTTAPILKGRYDSVSKRLDSIASVPIVCVGGNGLFSTLIVYGLLSYTSVVESYSRCYMKYELKGLI